MFHEKFVGKITVACCLLLICASFVEAVSDLNYDGIVDARDLYIVGKRYATYGIETLRNIAEDYGTVGVMAELPKYGIYIDVFEEGIPIDSEVSEFAFGVGNFWIRTEWYNSPEDIEAWAFLKTLGIKELPVIFQSAVPAGYDDDWSEWQSLMTAYLQTAVSLAPDMPAWEIGNEPDLTYNYLGYWHPPMTATQYMWFLTTAYNIIKAVNANALIIGAGFGCSTGVTLLQQIVDAGALDYLDGVSCHYYIRWGQVNFDAIKSVVAERKPIWMTETGWTTVDQNGGETAQNEYIVDYLEPATGIFATDPAIEVIIYFQLNDDHYPAQPITDDGWALTYGPEGNFGKKMAYYTFQGYLRG